MAGAGLNVRRGEPRDDDFVEELGKRTSGSSAAAFRHAPPAIVSASFERLLEIVYGQSHTVLVAEEDGVRKGFALLLDELPDEVTGLPQGFIAYMAVEPGSRRHGIGAALLAAAEDEAREQGLPYMGLMVTEENALARELYDRAGYFTERRLLCKIL